MIRLKFTLNSDSTFSCAIADGFHHPFFLHGIIGHGVTKTDAIERWRTLATEAIRYDAKYWPSGMAETHLLDVTEAHASNKMYQTIDACSEPGCRCDDRIGIILYDGPDRDEAEVAKSQAKYPEPIIREITKEY